jgi:hypothetical protein
MPEHRNVWPGHVFLAAGTILYTGPGAMAERHAHHAVQFVWSAGDRCSSRSAVGLWSVAPC